MIDHCTITDADYAGIAIYSGVGGRVTNNTVRRIGSTRTDFSISYKLNNAYGITFDRSSYNTTFATDPRSANFVVDNNLVTDVPLWMCYNVHAAENITFSNNTAMRCPRAFFIAGDSGPQHNPPIDITVTGNLMEDPVTKSGGTTDIEGVLICMLQGGTITTNDIAKAYAPYVYDYLGGSTNVKIASNTVIP